jgi:hypothetical protein
LQFEIKIYVNFILDVNYLEKQHKNNYWIRFLWSEIIKVEVSVISWSRRLRLITLTRDLDSFGYPKNLIQ